MRTRPGRPSPLGATWDGLGVNFALYAERAEAVSLVLFDSPRDRAPRVEIPLEERSGPVWHVFLPGLGPGQLYGYRVDGPHAPAEGLRFNPNKVLFDPYARAIGRPLRWHDSLFGYRLGAEDADLSFSTEDGAPYAPLGMVTDPGFAWGDDRRPDTPWEQTILYETHVRGATMRHPDIAPALRGTYLGFASEPFIDHLVSLGVTAVELLPIQAFVQDRVLVERGLRNYWGYSPLGYFAPEPSYAAGGVDTAVHEFKTMVRALHAAGIEVLIDVVYNHTGEGSELGPTLSYRGIDSLGYYKRSPADPRYPMDYTGTGNTLDPSNPFVIQLITDSLRHWVEEMHVDGFRFDLAPALGRDEEAVDLRGGFFKAIQQDPVLSRVKLIAEPWDVGPGGYRVGAFAWPWREWNGRYRDATRRYWRGDPRQKGELATRIAGSSDLYQQSERGPTASINFVCAHDGFTLDDLVSYERKHNEANGEGNRDGHEPNHSSNAGVEGPTRDPAILARRERRKTNLLATLLLSQGVPMLLGGDELSRTQHGNNNAYCQDDATSWLDWTLGERERRFLTTVRRLIRLRREHPIFSRHRFPTKPDELVWLHPNGRPMVDADWRSEAPLPLGLLLDGRSVDLARRGRHCPDDSFLLVFHRGTQDHRFVLPSPPGGGRWTLEWASGESATVEGGALVVPAESIAVVREEQPLSASTVEP